MNTPINFNLQNRNVIIYGTGDGTDKLLDFLEKKLETTKSLDIAVSDDFFREKTFRGVKTKPLSVILAEYINPVILLAFGSSRAAIVERFFALSDKYETFAPDLPIFGDLQPLDETLISAARNLFDDESKILFDNIVEYKHTWNIEFLKKSIRLPLFPKLKNISTIIDCGAYDGDTINIFSKMYPDARLFAIEPNPKIFKKLPSSSININSAVWNEDGEMSFLVERGRGASISELKNTECTEKIKAEKTIPVKTSKLDGIFADNNIEENTLIKLDVEGAEHNAILGSINIIEKFQPCFHISLYHRYSDLWELPLLLHKLNPNYKFSLSRDFSVPAWDIVATAYINT